LYAAHTQAQTTAFYYGPQVPRELLTVYDQVVVEPGHNHDLTAWAQLRAAPVAYFSIGEVAPSKQAGIERAWRVAENAAWSSSVMDLTHPGYRAYVLQQYEQLWAAGYKRFFLDTLDSYQLGTKDVAGRELQRRALCELIKAMAARHPDAHWLLNRGFELLPEIASHVHGVVAESLFDRWDAAQRRYVRVPEADRTWLLARLREVRTRYKLPVVVIDYRPTQERAAARATAQKIVKLGFQPWVCNYALNDLGVGALEVMPRRVLVVSDHADPGAQLGPVRAVAPVLEYLGYVPEYVSVAKGLPDYEVTAHYAGIVSVFESGFVSAAYERWLSQQIHAGVRIAVFGGLGVRADSALARELGITALPAPKPGLAHKQAVEITQRGAWIGFEAEPSAHDVEGSAVVISGQGVETQLELRTGQGALATAIATTRHGGFALSHVFAQRGLQGELAWVLEPFAFLKQALALQDLPVPDVSTESGRRVALFVIDAEGLAQPARLRGSPQIAHVLRTQILAKYYWPHALSVATTGVAADKSAAAALIAAGAAYGGELGLSVGTTEQRGPAPSLTGIEPLWLAQQPEHIPLPIAQDLSFIGAASEAYPLRRVLETLAFTDKPRRLRALALHYHAFALGSPGGLAALQGVYAKLAEQRLFSVRADEYRARVLAFREQVVVRDTAGAFARVGGSALRSLRVPVTMGLPDLQRSRGVAGFVTVGSERYVTFTADPGAQLVLSQVTQPAPYVIDTNGKVERFERSAAATQHELQIDAALSLSVRFGGLPAQSACSLKMPTRLVSGRSDAAGEWQLDLPEHTTGRATLTCAQEAS
jgi:hypothetical protein